MLPHIQIETGKDGGTGLLLPSHRPLYHFNNSSFKFHAVTSLINLLIAVICDPPDPLKDLNKLLKLMDMLLSIFKPTATLTLSLREKMVAKVPTNRVFRLMLFFVCDR